MKDFEWFFIKGLRLRSARQGWGVFVSLRQRYEVESYCKLDFLKTHFISKIRT